MKETGSVRKDSHGLLVLALRLVALVLLVALLPLLAGCGTGPIVRGQEATETPEEDTAPAEEADTPDAEATPTADEDTPDAEAAAPDSPQLTHGPISGEVGATSVVLWARGNQAGSLTFEVTNDPATVETVAGLLPVPDVTITPTQELTSTAELPPTEEPPPSIDDLEATDEVTDTTDAEASDEAAEASDEAAEEAQPLATVTLTATTAITAGGDYTGQVVVDELEPANRYVYTATLTLADGATSEPVVGIFETAPTSDTAAAFSFAFGACLGGQGFCRPVDTGWTIFNTISATEPDFFVYTGDTVYVDTACVAGETYVPGAEGPYSDLEGFRTRYRYHLEDQPYSDFLARTPVYVTWDDHEVLNDSGGPQLNAINPQLFADGQHAFFEYWPLLGSAEEPYRIYRQVSYGAHADMFMLDTRSYRDPNVDWDPDPETAQPKSMLGADQFAWLQAGLANSEATWKFIVTSVPLAYPTGFPQPQVNGRDGWADFTERSGYETELQALLFFLEAEDISNVVFVAGDTHWPYAISYDPDRNGEPNFYELASSPLSAISLNPATTLDQSFNPTVLYAEGDMANQLFNFGHISVAADGSLTFRVIDADGSERYNLALQPE